MKIAVSAVGAGLDVAVDPRFGRCLYFVIVETDTMVFKALQNTSQNSAHGAGIQAAQVIANNGVQVVLTGNVGPNAFQALSAARIQVFSGVYGTVREVVTRYMKGELKKAGEPTVSGHFGVGGGRGMGRGRRGRSV